MLNDNLETDIPQKGIRPYAQLDVVLTYQNFGSTWLGILRGSSENIELVFNGLYNLGATNGDYQFYDGAQTVAIFWTDKKSMRHSLVNSYFSRMSTQKRGNPRSLIRLVKNYGRKQLAALRQHGHEAFMNFANKYEAQCHGVGTIRAERPDADFKDSVMAHAFSDKSE